MAVWAILLACNVNCIFARRAWLEGQHLPLCHPGIVQGTCKQLFEQPKFSISEASQDERVVRAHELAETLAASQTSVFNFFEYLDIGHVDMQESSRSVNRLAVKCSDLCEQTLQSLPKNNWPPSSDMACYAASTGTECTVDVSDLTFADLHFETATDDGEAQYGERSQALNLTLADTGSSIVWRPSMMHVVQKPLSPSPMADVELSQMRIDVLNLFRIYPPVNLQIEDADSDDASTNDVLDDLEAPEDMGLIIVDNHQDEELKARKVYTRVQEQNISLDLRCDLVVKGAIQRTGFWSRHIISSAVDCKCPSGEVVAGHSKACSDPYYVKDRRKFDRARLINEGCFCTKEENVAKERLTRCSDKNPTGFENRNGSSLPCSKLRKKCRDSQIAAVCPQTCGMDCTSRSLSSEADWKQNVMQLAVKAQAYSAKAIQKMGTSSMPKLVRKWFGNDARFTRHHILGVLNGVHRLLSNVDYVYPGKRCSPGMFAYVFPKSPLNKNGRGNFVFHLCPKFLQASDSEKIETLTHEGSHHETMYTDDVCFHGTGKDCTKAYGRHICQLLADRDSKKALQNADNYCFFINDATNYL